MGQDAGAEVFVHHSSLEGGTGEGTHLTPTQITSGHLIQSQYVAFLGRCWPPCTSPESLRGETHGRSGRTDHAMDLHRRGIRPSLDGRRIPFLFLCLIDFNELR